MDPTHSAIKLAPESSHLWPNLCLPQNGLKGRIKRSLPPVGLDICMRFARGPIRLLATVLVTLGVVASGFCAPHVARASSREAHGATSRCCCGTPDGKCCGTGCCTRQAPKPERPATPLRSLGQREFTSPLGLAADGLMSGIGGDVRSGAVFAGPFVVLVCLTLQTSHVRIQT